MDASDYALVHGIRATRGALAVWQARPWPVLRRWLVGSLAAALVLLAGVWLVATVSSSWGTFLKRPPLVVGGPREMLRILEHNFLVLALHAMACVAGFIAGASLPLQARQRRGWTRHVHERGGQVAIAFVIAATTFSLCTQAFVLGKSVALVSSAIHTSPGLLILALLPHAVPELVALFLPLAAWITASRRGEWDQLLAATLVTVALAVPTLMLAAIWEVYGAPHLLAAMFGYAPA